MLLIQFLLLGEGGLNSPSTTQKILILLYSGDIKNQRSKRFLFLFFCSFNPCSLIHGNFAVSFFFFFYSPALEKPQARREKGTHKKEAIQEKRSLRNSITPST